MDSQDTILALALLKTNWELKRRSYIDNFNLLTAEILRRSEHEVVSAPQVQQELRSAFGLDLPLNTVATLLKRAAKQGFVSLTHGVYKINRNAVARLPFAELQQSALQIEQQARATADAEKARADQEAARVETLKTELAARERDGLERHARRQARGARVAEVISWAVAALTAVLLAAALYLTLAVPDGSTISPRAKVLATLLVALITLATWVTSSFTVLSLRARLAHRLSAPVERVLTWLAGE